MQCNAQDLPAPHDISLNTTWGTLQARLTPVLGPLYIKLAVTRGIG